MRDDAIVWITIGGGPAVAFHLLPKCKRAGSRMVPTAYAAALVAEARQCPFCESAVNMNEASASACGFTAIPRFPIRPRPYKARASCEFAPGHKGAHGAYVRGVQLWWW